jgi:LysR family transcriptional regulator, positive regulator for ilvC
MDQAVLRLFIAVCRTRHFGRAGELCHLSSSAVTRGIQRLESVVGKQLFVRDNRSVLLTESGEIFKRYAEDVLDRWQDLQRELGENELELSGTLTLFASVTASQSILPNILSRFREDYPGIHIQLETGYAVNALQRLHDGADVVVAALPDAEDDQLIKRIITDIPIQTVAPVDAPALAPLLGGDVDWSAVPLVLPAAGQARDSIDEWFRDQRLTPNIYAEVSGNEAILSLVALGCGVGFVPSLVVSDSPLANRVRVLASGPQLNDFHVGFCTRRRSVENSSIIRAFWASI